MTPKMINRERVLARLAKLPEAVKQAVTEQLAKEVADLVAAQKRAAPFKTGRFRDSIHAEPAARPLSYRIVAGGAATTKKIRAGVSDADFSKALASGGNQGEFDYARAAEFGHRTKAGAHVAGRPSFFPTYRARKKPMQRRLKAASRKALKTLYPKE